MPPFNPPQAVQSAARRGLKLRQKKEAGTAVGIARARDLSNGRPVSLDTIGRMVSFFARHGAQKPSNPGTDADPTPWLVAWLLWGGDAGRDWAESVWRRYGPDAAREDYWREVRWREARTWSGELPEGLSLGRPFRLASVGEVYSRFSGKSLGALSEPDLREMAAGCAARAMSTDAVIIDWAHASAPDDPASQDPRRGAAMGRVVDAWVEDEGDGRGLGLFVLPAWTELGRQTVPQQVGALWSSPEWRRGDSHDRATGERVAGVELLAVGLTPRPAQRHDRVDPVLWSEKGGPMEGELSQEAFDALRAERDALKARLAELEAAEGSMEGEAPAEMAEVAKMREALTAQAGEVSKMREEHAKLLASLDAEKRDRLLDRIVAEGRQPESARAIGAQLYAVREQAPDAWRAWSEAPAKAPERVSQPGGVAQVPVGASMVADAEAKATASGLEKGSAKWREAVSVNLSGAMRAAVQGR